MYLPTITDQASEKRHIVRDQKKCQCGFTYNHFYTFTKKDFKKIKFKHLNDVTCYQCKSTVL